MSPDYAAWSGNEAWPDLAWQSSVEALKWSNTEARLIHPGRRIGQSASIVEQSEVWDDPGCILWQKSWSDQDIGGRDLLAHYDALLPSLVNDQSGGSQALGLVAANEVGRSRKP